MGHIFEIQKEMLELAIKAGRRMAHDYQHMVNELLRNNVLSADLFQDRAKHWESIFYPEDGLKDYRTKLHLRIQHLEK